MTAHLICDICGFTSSNPEEHEHKELEIGGVPMNIWTIIYSLPHYLKLDDNSRGIARYKSYIPFEINQAIVDDEGSTPLTQIEENVFLKDESHNPTGSFKDRGSVMLVSDALSKGKKKIAIPSTGNAAVSLGYYANKAKLESIVFAPENLSSSKRKQIENKSTLICNKDLIESYERFFEFCKANPSIYNGFPVTNLPYLQGIKTIAYEIFLEKGVPDWLVIPIGSGVDIVSQYQGFKDLISIGAAKKMPRFVGIQIQGADPITQGYEKKQYNKVMILDKPVSSKAEAIASDTCFNYLKIMKILKETDGLSISVKDNEIERSDQAPWLEFSSRSIFPALEKIINRREGRDMIVLLGTARDKENTK